MLRVCVPNKRSNTKRPAGVKSGNLTSHKKRKKQRSRNVAQIAQLQPHISTQTNQSVEEGQTASSPIRSQLFNSVASRGKSATFWADLQQTYFAPVEPKLAVEHLVQIRRDLDQSSVQQARTFC